VSAGQTPVIATVPRISPSVLLTPKEREVLRLLAGNLSNKQIANALGVGDQTIKWHLKNLFGKLSVGTRQHLLGRARMLGILE
jgi:LuxR family maltose regulon positive regulatory protein